jgi:hypothetical protein
MVSMQCNQPTLRLPEAVVLVSVSLLLLLPVGLAVAIASGNVHSCKRISRQQAESWKIVNLVITW